MKKMSPHTWAICLLMLVVMLLAISLLLISLWLSSCLRNVSLSSKLQSLKYTLCLEFTVSRTPPSNHSSLMYTHVYMKSDNAFHCAIGSQCTRVKVTVAKKTVSTSQCPHEHIATLLSDLPQGEDAVPEQPGARVVPKFTESEWTANTSAYLYKHRKLDMSQRQKKLVEKRILETSAAGWPRHFEPDEDKCPECLADLGPPVKHQGDYTLTVSLLEPLVSA